VLQYCRWLRPVFSRAGQIGLSRGGTRNVCLALRTLIVPLWESDIAGILKE